MQSPFAPQGGSPQAAPHTRTDTGAASGRHASGEAGATGAVDAADQAPAPTAFMTGAYQLSGNYAIDRMLQLEQALKRFGPLV